MVNFGYPYNDLVICKDSTDYLEAFDVFAVTIRETSECELTFGIIV